MATTKNTLQKMNIDSSHDKIYFLPVDDLLLDPTNPRLPQDLMNKNESKILNWILEFGNLPELMTSIAENGYFEGEPLLVVPSESKIGKSGKWVVIEGNRRLSAMKILNDPKKATVRESTIADIIENAKKEIVSELPVLKFNNENEILDYLGYRHITGVKQWSPLAKARYLDKLYKSKKSITDLNEKYRTLANIIGSKANYVKRMHTTYRVYQRIADKQFFSIPGLSEESIEFSNLNDALTKFKHVGHYVGLDFLNDDPIKKIKEESLKNLCEWMFSIPPGAKETRIGEVRNLPKLNAILNPENKLARQTFIEKKESIDKAYLMTDEPSKALSKALLEAYDSLDAAQNIFYSIENPTNEDAELLKRINNLAFHFYEAISSKTNPSKKLIV